MNIRTRVAMLIVWPLLVSSGLRAQNPAGPAGHWEGSIYMPNQNLPFSVDLARNATGAWIGTLSITGMPAKDVPLSDIVVDGSRVRFFVGLLEAPTFDGTIAADGASYAGTASNYQGSVAFEMKRAGEPSVKLPPASSPLSQEFAGTWQASVPGADPAQQIVLTLSAGPDGAARAAFGRTNQQQVPIVSVVINGRTLELESRAVSGTFKGTLGASGELAGEWTEPGRTVPLTFKRGS